MKTILVTLLALLGFLQAPAQVSLDLSLDQDEFLPNEAIHLTVKITNQSGETLHLGAEPNWLTFGVESVDGGVIIKNDEVPVVEKFDLESSQMAIKHVDLQPYFQLNRPGRYKVVATMRIKEWAMSVNSAPAHIDIINGGQVWSQNFGVVVMTNAVPESRKYTLLKANFLRHQLRLYVQISSGDGADVYKVAPLGTLVSFSSPEGQVDQFSQLHVLWQTGAQTFCYAIISADGTVASRELYDNYNSRPHLVVNDSGEIRVQGGVRRPQPTDVPPLNLSPPSAVPATSSVPAGP